MVEVATEPNNQEQGSPLDGFENYEIVRQIGRSIRNSTVFECTDLVHHRQCALKVFKQFRTTSEQRKINREIDVLRRLAGGPNIISLLDVVVDVEGLKRALVLELVDHIDFRSLFPRLGDSDVRNYMGELLQALRFCHGRGIIHRDIRGHNVVIDHEAGKLRLVGWGSATPWHPGRKYAVRVSIFKAPELLLGHQTYGPSLDMWEFGTMLASMVFRREPFFHGNSNLDQLVRLSGVLGTSSLFDFVARYGIELEPQITQALEQPLDRRPWASFVTPENRHLATWDALDLVDKLLRFDPEDRLTVDEALKHPYFETVIS
ncbi:hypothetical protein BGZ63DRAFT_396385 [Mariannaea sp. PMI_226]|nr:hypothetical protein BGZ63DRAFT_396385 [Mariannaea sp. PMI_226]